ncbi:MAG: acyltransferase [Thermoclostridium sp.]|nr:acyltransferase [Thermoclostridium sp.]
MDHKHIDAFDYLRFFAMSAVIFMHVASGPLRSPGGIGWMLLNPFVSLAFTAVPLFFMMSGYLLMTSAKTAEVSTLKARLPRLIVPLVFWSVVACGWEAWRDRQSLQWLINKLISMIRGPVAVHFWFMYTLIAMYLISPFLYRCFHNLPNDGRKWLGILLGLILLTSMVSLALPEKLAVYASVKPLEELRFFSGHLCSFLIGWLLGTIERKIPNRWLILTALAIWGLISAGTWYLTSTSGAYDSSFQTQSGGFEILLAACLFLLAMQNLKQSPRFLKFFAPLTFGIYLMHNILNSMLSHFGMVPSGFTTTCVKSLVVLAGCTGFVALAGLIKPLRFFTTGNR